MELARSHPLVRKDAPIRKKRELPEEIFHQREIKIGLGSQMVVLIPGQTCRLTVVRKIALISIEMSVEAG
jgi:hypothetical protein